jgi:hypothetical protein
MSKIRKISDLLHRESESRIVVTITCPKYGEYTGEAVPMLDFLGREQKMPPPCPACEREFDDKIAREKEESRKRRKINRLRSMNV